MRRFSTGLVVFLAVGVALVAPGLWFAGAFERSEQTPPLVAHLLERYATQHTIFVAHIAGGGVALLVALLQFVRRWRTRGAAIHRANGYVYATAVAIGGTAGLVLGVSAWAGPVAQIGFSALAIAWIATTGLGVQRIVAGDRTGHRAWMTRSFALAFAAVSLRVQMPLFGAIGVPIEIAYPIVAWSSWVPNLVVAQLVLLRRSSAGVVPVQRRNARVNELCSENPSR